MLYLDRKTATQNAGKSLIDKFKADTKMEDLLAQYGYIKRSSTQYQSPNSKSGHLCEISQNQDMIISLSSSDANIGIERNGSWCADAFDLFKFFECGNDTKTALEKLKVRYPLVKENTKVNDFNKVQVGQAKLNFDDLFTKLSEIDPTPPVPLIEGIIFTKSLISVTGASESGKSFFVLDAVLSIASGLDFHGHFTKQGKVGLVIGEGQDGIYQRCEAWCAAKDVIIEDLPIVVSKQPFNMRDRDFVRNVIDVFNEKGKWEVIVIDTLARNFGAGNENAPSDMGEFIMACDEIIYALGCSVIVVHHTGKHAENGARGHSSFYGALTTELTVQAKGDHDVVVTCTKQKDAKHFDPMQFVKIETLNSLTLSPVEFTKGQGKSKLSDGNRYAFNTFAEAYTAKQATNGSEINCRLHLDEWREIFVRRHPGDNKKSKDQAFRRARISLVNKGLLKVEDNYYSYGDMATTGDKF